MRRRYGKTKLSVRTEQAEDVNPMESVANLVDAMLVLACGLMLALIINWKVDITGVSASVPEEEPAKEQIAISEEDMTDADTETLDAEALQRIGALYYDEETGMYYAITGD